MPVESLNFNNVIFYYLKMIKMNETEKVFLKDLFEIKNKVGELEIQNIQAFLLESAKQLTIYKVIDSIDYFNNAKNLLLNIYNNFTFGANDDQIVDILKSLRSYEDSREDLIGYEDILLPIELDHILISLRSLYKETKNIQKISRKFSF